MQFYAVYLLRCDWNRRRACMQSKCHNCASGRSAVKSTDNHTLTHILPLVWQTANATKKTWKQHQVVHGKKECIRVRSSWKLHLNKLRFMFYTHTHTHIHLPTSANNERERGSFTQWSICPIKYAMFFALLLLSFCCPLLLKLECYHVARLFTGWPQFLLLLWLLLLSCSPAIQAPIALQILWNARLIPEEPQFWLHFAAAKGPHKILFIPWQRVH